METISPFELKNKLIDMADESVKKIAHTMLNAGRGNPNWIATEPREAFFLLGQFGLCECRRAFSLEEGIAGIPQKAGIAARFEAFLKDNEKAPGANLLKEGYNYMLMEHTGIEPAASCLQNRRRPIATNTPYSPAAFLPAYLTYLLYIFSTPSSNLTVILSGYPDWSDVYERCLILTIFPSFL